MKLALLSVAVVLAGCSTTFGGPDGVTVTVPAVTVEAPHDHGTRVYLRRHHVERGIRYCEYSNGRVYQRHWRYDCPRYHY